MTLDQKLYEILAVSPWCRKWMRCGMICVSANGKAFELKDNFIGGGVTAIGCGGWDPDGRLHWVGLDLDVGHGAVDPAKQFDSTEAAIRAARTVREFVGGAAEIRRSKSGIGLHVRVAIAPLTIPLLDAIAFAPDAGGVENVMHGRSSAPLIAKWLAATLELAACRSAAGRQNLWFWAAQTGERGFELVEEAIGEWRVPTAALKPIPLPSSAPPASSAVKSVTPDRQKVIDRAAKYLAKVEPAVSGSGGHNQTFHAASVLVQGFDLSIDEARPLLWQWNLACTPPWSERELEHKLQSAAKASGPRGELLNQERPATGAGRWQSRDFSGHETVIDGLPNESEVLSRESGVNSQKSPNATPADKKKSISVVGVAGGKAADLRAASNDSKQTASNDSSLQSNKSATSLGDKPSVRPVHEGLFTSEAKTPAEWLEKEFYIELCVVSKMDPSIKRDRTVETLFAKLAVALPQATAVTSARVKDTVCELMEMGRRDYDAAYRQTRAAMCVASGGEMDFPGLVKKFLSGWTNDAPNEGTDRTDCQSPHSERHIKFWREEWYEWIGGCYCKLSPAAMRAEAVKFLTAAGAAVTTAAAANFLLALEAVTFLSDEIEPPTWLEAS